MALRSSASHQTLLASSLAGAVSRSVQRIGALTLQTATPSTRPQKQMLLTTRGLLGRMSLCRAPLRPLSQDPVPSRRWCSTNKGKEQESDDDFIPQRKAVSTNPDEVSEIIRQQVEKNKVMLYMKGTPSQPQCGFSAQVVRILHAQGASFSSVNVLDYPSIREGIKTFSEWPTVPQVYISGQFVGGCDIVSQMHQSGELETMLKKEGVV